MTARFLMLLIVLFGSGAFAQTSYHTKNPDEARQWFLTHSHSVTVMGSTPLFPGFTDALVAGLLQKRMKVQIITGDAGVQPFRRVAQAGGSVRLRSGAFTAKNGYSGTIVLLDARYMLTRRGDIWFLIEYVEAVTQVQSRFDLLWQYCQPIPLR